MHITVLYGTESGNSELIAEDLGQALAADHEVTVSDLQDYDPAQLAGNALTLIVCSTHGEGELPNTAIPFAEALDALQPDLSGLRYAMFGLGDTFYEETYSQGSELLDRRFTELGGTRIGEYGRHDASSWDLGSDVALEWLPGVIEAFEAAVVS
ncbi:flavodoxin domain-containing protein [Leucobacter sp. M11]|uniref:flavodoxin domain-containing protein n=1 Tax=Leucobacter sp. M11 TaxID=2993565 RepID=UPI002D811770|nr:flavodoxin domain-containing protein [Leucobacter sp. M11]MEB4614744.1 flavodoxin domain-containing protein [Leucobacter sp. M11]